MGHGYEKRHFPPTVHLDRPGRARPSLTHCSHRLQPSAVHPGLVRVTLLAPAGPTAAGPSRSRRMLRSGMFGPAACSLAAVCGVRSSAMQRSAHDSGCRLARGLDVHPYVSAPAVNGPKVQRHDGAIVGPAHSTARGPACSITARGPARGADRVSPKKPSHSRLVVRPGWPVHGPGRDSP
jgi:hypothetical protein